MFSFSLKRTRWTALFASLVLLFMAGSLFVSCTEPDPDPDEQKIDAQQPSISVQPQGGTWDVSEDDEFTLTLTASVTDSGTLSYQWYKGTDASSTTGGAAIGTDDKTLTLAKADYLYNDDYYFYVAVTNTIDDNGDGGTKTAASTSNAVKVTVSGNLVNAHHPSITGQPQGGTWDITAQNGGTFTLTVTASVTDGGQLSYQWYKNTSNSTTGGTTIGTNSATLSLAKGDYTTNGDYYFYVVVTNTITDNNDGGLKTATATSSVATVTVSGNSGGTPVNAQQPNISTQPTGGNWNVSSANTSSLTVTAAVTDGGTLSYQWYKNTSNTTTGGTAIGTNSANLSLAKGEYTTNGAYYFYVVVTNTNNAVNGTKTATATSNVATVTVSGNSGAEVNLPVGLDGYFQTTLDITTYDNYTKGWMDGIAIDRNAKTITYYTNSLTMGDYWKGTIVSYTTETNGTDQIAIVEITEIAGSAWGPSATGVFFPVLIRNFAYTASPLYGAFQSANPYSSDPDAKNDGVATLAEAISEYTNSPKGYFTLTGTYNLHTMSPAALSSLQGKWEWEDDSDFSITISGRTVLIYYEGDGDGAYDWSDWDSDDMLTAIGDVEDYVTFGPAGNSTGGIMYMKVIWTDDYDLGDYLAVGWDSRSGNSMSFYVSSEEEGSLAEIKAAYATLDSLDDDELGTFTKQ